MNPNPQRRHCNASEPENPSKPGLAVGVWPARGVGGARGFGFRRRLETQPQQLVLEGMAHRFFAGVSRRVCHAARHAAMTRATSDGSSNEGVPPPK